MSEEYYDAMQELQRLRDVNMRLRDAIREKDEAVDYHKSEAERLREENERLEAGWRKGDMARFKLREENERLREALQKVLDDSEIGVVPRSHLDRIERLLGGEG